MKNRKLIATLNWRGLNITSEQLNSWSLWNIPCECLWQKINDSKLSETLKTNPQWWDMGRLELEWLAQNSAQFCIFGDKDYPENFYHFDDPPLVITYFGKASWNICYNLAIVGSRNPESSVLMWMDYYISKIKNVRNINIVSGGARGVDQKAHTVALRLNAPTTCFLPSGLRELYPSTLCDWVDPIIEAGGAVISQFSPFQPMYKCQFHFRNRLISAMSHMVLVGEARRRSGSLLTAKIALDQGKPLAVLPCSPMTTSGLGSLDLIFDGAQLIRDHLDLDLYIESSLGPFQL